MSSRSRRRAPSKVCSRNLSSSSEDRKFNRLPVSTSSADPSNRPRAGSVPGPSRTTKAPRILDRIGCLICEALLAYGSAPERNPHEVEPYDKSASHIRQDRMFQKSRRAVSIRFLSILHSGRSTLGRTSPRGLGEAPTNRGGQKRKTLYSHSHLPIGRAKRLGEAGWTAVLVTPYGKQL